MKIKEVFLPKSGAGAFFISILVWGIGIGCFGATMNNFLSEVYHINEFERGLLEFFRELPGFALVFILALMHRVSDWKILRLGTMISMLGAALLLIPSDKFFITGFIMIWSLGEHLVMPIRSAIAMQIAKPGNAGLSLGYLSSVMNFGNVAGSLLVAIIFYVGVNYFECARVVLFNITWGFIVFLMLISTITTFSKNAPNKPSKRPRLYLNRKFNKFYALELFYGARKQIFITFAPYLLIREYGFETKEIALLFGICAAINIYFAPLVGKLTDKWGYRNTMIWDTVVLFFVCLLYGFAGDIFPAKVAIIVIYANFIFDMMLSTTSLATNLYVREITTDQDEITSTLSTGISINHLISIIAAPLGGWVWHQYGVGVLFSFAAVMAICNSIFAYTLPKPAKKANNA